MPKFAQTLTAVDKGLENTKADKGAHLIEDWENELADTEVSGAKGILKDLESLKKQLERPEPNGERIQTLLGRLGEATTKIADKSEKSQEKLKELGAALSKAGGGQ